MSNVTIQAASYLNADGYGSTAVGRRQWPIRQNDVTTMPWPDFLDAECSRFGRMDALSRAGVTAVELLAVDFTAMAPERKDGIGVCLETCYGSLSVDVDFLRAPGPSSFIYTLPTSVVGEICIRHRLKGPVVCLLSGTAAGHTAIEEVTAWIASCETDEAICLCCDAIGALRDGVRVGIEGLDRVPAWRACAMFLKNGTEEERAGILLKDMTRGGAGIFDICERLCGKRGVSA